MAESARGLPPTGSLRKGGRQSKKAKAKKQDLGSLGQKALSKLAAFKKEKSKDPLERMWERRCAGQSYYSDYTT